MGVAYPSAVGRRGRGEVSREPEVAVVVPGEHHAPGSDDVGLIGLMTGEHLLAFGVAGTFISAYY